LKNKVSKTGLLLAPEEQNIYRNNKQNKKWPDVFFTLEG
jgi:hypothetical protein